jgi:hypothetical protein
MKTTLRTLIPLWLGWFLLIYGFQALIHARIVLYPPDQAVPWSAAETRPDSNAGKVYLLETFMNNQVAWDSEYYIGIAVGGYDDPAAGKVTTNATSKPIAKNYSFFPFYPALMALIKFPFLWFGMNPIAAATAAGSVVALLGTLAGMIALYELTREHFDAESGFRAAFYMLIFPTAFFFAMIYTEGLFVGLAFWSLLLAKRKQWIAAGILGFLAAWTRAHGAAMTLPLIVIWLQQMDANDRMRSIKNGHWRLAGLAALLPLIGYGMWRASNLGAGWAMLQPGYFSRGLLNIEGTIGSLAWMVPHALQYNSAMIYLVMEIASILLTLIASLWLLKRDPALALFSLAIVILSTFSGSFQSLARYMLIAPALYIFLARLGRSSVFDRVWTIASILLMGMSAMLYAFDFWVG